MKKILFITAFTLILLIVVLCGCQDTDGVPPTSSADTTTEETVVFWRQSSTPLLIDFCDCQNGFRHNGREYEMKEPLPTVPAPGSVTVQFDGKTYTGNFDGESRYTSNMFDTYKYRVPSEGTANVRFEITVDGTLILFERTNDAFDPYRKELTESECRAVVEAFLTQMGLDGFLPSVPYVTKESHKYTFRYTRRVADFDTLETVIVGVSTNGEIISFLNNSAAALNRLNDLSGVDLDAVKASIYERLDEFAENTETEYDSVSYGEPCYRLTALKDGTLALWCDVTVDTRQKLSEDIWTGGACSYCFILPLVPISAP